MPKNGHILYNQTVSNWWGQVPPQIINEKYRESCHFYDPNMIKDYQMDTMKVWGTEKPFAEQDRPRDHRQTSNIINLRMRGSRYGSLKPDHSEANFELTEKDPRGNYNLPIFENFRKQQEFRAPKWKYQYGVDGSKNFTEKRLGLFDRYDKLQETRNRYKQMLTIFNRARTDNPRAGYLGYERRMLSDYVKIDENKYLARENGEKHAVPYKIFNVNNEPKYGMGSIADHHMTESGLGLTRQVKLRKYKSPISDADVDNKFANSDRTLIRKAMQIHMKNLLDMKKHQLLSQEDIKDITRTGTLHHNKFNTLSVEDKMRVKEAMMVNDALTQFISKHRETFVKNNHKDFDRRKIVEKTTKDARDWSTQYKTLVRKNKLFEKTKSDIGKSRVRLYGKQKETVNYKKLLKNKANYNRDMVSSDARNEHIERFDNARKQFLKNPELKLENYRRDLINSITRLGRKSVVKKSNNIKHDTTNHENFYTDTSGFYKNHEGFSGISRRVSKDGSYTAGGKFEKELNMEDL